MISALCRDCFTEGIDSRHCVQCRSTRLLCHPDRNALEIAHVDCDAFYATIEKRDNPALKDKAVIVGGGRRGVVATCCYIARLSGVRSAMPMFKALEACPDAVVIAPDMAKYKAVSSHIRVHMEKLTPIIEPLSIDEAFLDLRGTQRVHGLSPVAMLVRFQKAVEQDLGISVSIGLSVNKFLAKFASEFGKPRGFHILTAAEGRAALAPLPVERLWGVGAAGARRLQARGFRLIADLQALDDIKATRLLGDDGVRLARLARGEDARPVQPDRERKSVSSETTFNVDHSARHELEPALRDCADRVAQSLRRKSLLARKVVLKLKTANFEQITRTRLLPQPTDSTAVLLEFLLPLLAQLCDGTAYRLIGAGVELADAGAQSLPLPLDPLAQRRATLERTVDALRGRLGAPIGIGDVRRGAPASHPYGVDDDDAQT